MKAIILVLGIMTGSVWAQQTTPNLVGTNLSPAPAGTQFQWSGFVVTDSTGMGFSGGNVPAYNPSTGQFMFGYTQSTIAYSLAINSALAGSGIQIGGMQYGMTYYNQDSMRGTLSLSAAILSNTGAVLQSYNHSLPPTTAGWTQWSQTQTFANPYSLASVGYATLAWTGKDATFWAGYYGPQFRDPYLTLTYTVDQCAANPLSSPECAGYQQALFTQQCTANPLYDSACPGYTTAYHDQQCSISALHATTCPGYQQAYFSQQCTANPLYNNQCPGYQQAYFDQQCGLNPLYDSGCPNYAIVTRATTPPAPDTNTEPVASETSTPAVAMITDAATTDPVASNAAASSATSATSPTSVSPAAVVSVVNPPAAPAPPAPSAKSAEREAARAEAKAAEQKAEQKKTERAVARLLPKSTVGGESAVSAAAAERAAEAAADSASATTIEAQQAAQNVVMGMMGFNPAFSAYQNAIVPDVNAATMARQYNRPTVDNRRALRALSGASDRLHQDMVDQQYGRTYQ